MQPLVWSSQIDSYVVVPDAIPSYYKQDKAHLLGRISELVLSTMATFGAGFVGNGEFRIWFCQKRRVSELVLFTTAKVQTNAERCVFWKATFFVCATMGLVIISHYYGKFVAAVVLS